MEPVDMRALNAAFASIEGAIDNLNARLTAVMAFAAALPGADRVEVDEVLRRLASLSLDPVLGSTRSSPEAFVEESTRQLISMATVNKTSPPKPAVTELHDLLNRQQRRNE